METPHNKRHPANTEAHMALPRWKSEQRSRREIVIPEWAARTLAVISILVSPLSAVIVMSTALWIYVKSYPRRKAARARADQLATLMGMALSTDEGTRMVRSAIRLGTRTEALRQMASANLVETRSNLSEDSESSPIPQGMNPDGNGGISDAAELEAFGLTNARMIEEKRPGKRSLWRREVPLNVTFVQMEA